MRSFPLFHHQVQGKPDAPWVTFIPGIGNDASFWAVHAEILAADYQVLTFDPWGHNLSPLPPEPCSYQAIVDGVIALWDHLGIEKSSVVGLGFGGSVSLSLGVTYPQRIEKIVACCCRPRQPNDRHDFWRDRCAKARANGLDKLGDITVDRWLSDDFRQLHPEVDQQLRAMIKRTTVEGYCAYVNAFIEMDFSKQLGQITAPVLLLAAEHDHGGGPVEDMQAMAAQLPNAQLNIIQGSGHICNFEAPDQVATQLKNFFKS
ncbi:3-oxoadipate enol-lactonase [Acinetobacter sp. SFB]|uniref:alpha/beta fold hydrolase n=1 Tax=Acinetobacter sp. SFB TaxID=1805634 RepID=UPI0007D78463|nr:alpha/beta hydrolase [Acinetobacter sp. SFB]OAL78385.1 3-oxoadipate enol-lactonase [Acinetobacter sp. SFB]